MHVEGMHWVIKQHFRQDTGMHQHGFWEPWVSTFIAFQSALDGLSASTVPQRNLPGVLGQSWARVNRLAVSALLQPTLPCCECTQEDS